MPATLTFVTGGSEDVVAWGEFLDDAQAMAAALQARGVAPGDHVAVLGPTTRPLVTAIQAIWLAGATLVVLPLPMRLGSIEEFVAQTRTAHPRRRRRAAWSSTPTWRRSSSRSRATRRWCSLDDLAAGAGAPDGERFDRPTYDPDALGDPAVHVRVARPSPRA